MRRTLKNPGLQCPGLPSPLNPGVVFLKILCGLAFQTRPLHVNRFKHGKRSMNDWRHEKVRHEFVMVNEVPMLNFACFASCMFVMFVMFLFFACHPRVSCRHIGMSPCLLPFKP